MSKTRLPFLSLATLLLAAKVIALPTDPTVRSGSLAVERTGSSMTLRQQTARAAADFASFDVAAGERVTVLQPSSSSLLLARVTGGLPTRLDGYVQANGSLVVANPHGVLVGASGVIETGSFAAVALEADGSRLDAGQLVFSAGAAGAEVVNAGRITVADAGLAALVGPRVVNTGLISARLGRVQLAGGSRATLDLAGDGFLQLALGDGGSVEQSGVVRAEGGRILITADAAAGALAGVVNVDGLVEASSLVAQGGRITLSAAGGTARVGGELAASSGAARGGDIDLSGGVVIMAKAKADVSGEAGGGRFVAKAAEAISAEGDFSARAGALGGDGGFVELSGRDSADVAGARVDTRALVGRCGTFLLDPLTVTVDATLAASIVSNLATTDFVVQADNSITVSSAINYSGARAARLTLDAGTGAVHAGTITVSAAINSTASALTLVVDGNATFNNKPSLNGGQIRAQGAAGVTLNSGSWNDTLFTGVSALTIGAATYTTSADGALDSLKLNHASSVLDGTGTLTLGALEWTFGAMSGAGKTVLSGSGLFTATPRHLTANPPTLNRRLDVSQGATLTLRDASGYSAGSYLYFSSNTAVLNNAGTIEILGYSTLPYEVRIGSAGTVNNLATGVIRAGSATNSNTIGLLSYLTAFNNQGGTLTVGSATSELRLDNANAFFEGASTGHLKVTLYSGNATLRDGASLTAITQTAGATNSTTMTVNGAASIDMLALSRSGAQTASINGTGTLTLGGLDWTGGDMTGSGTTVLAPGGVFRVTTKDLGAYPPTLTRRLDVSQGATLTLRDAAGYSGGSYLYLSSNTAVLNNAGTIEILGYSTLPYEVRIGTAPGYQVGTVNNLATGVIRAGSATNSNTIGLLSYLTAFNNQGGTLTVGSETSELRLDNANAFFEGASTGHLKVTLYTGNATLQDGASLTAFAQTAGTNPTTMTVNGSASIGMFKLSKPSGQDATVTGPGTLTLGGLDWTGGDMRGNGKTVLAGSGLFTATPRHLTANPPTLNRRLDVSQGATLTLRDASGYSAGSYLYFSSNTAVLNNAGTIEILGYSTLPYEVRIGTPGGYYAGTVNNLATGVIRAGSATNSNTIGLLSYLTAFNNQGGTLTVGSATSELRLDNANAFFEGASTGHLKVTLYSGNATLRDGASLTAITQTAGATNSTTMTVNGAASIDMLALSRSGAQPGSINGTGTLTLGGLDWTGGEMTGSGTTVLAPGGVFRVTTKDLGAYPPTLSRRLDVPQGATLTLRDAGGYSGGSYLYFSSNAAVLNNAGTVEILSYSTQPYDVNIGTPATDRRYGTFNNLPGGLILGGSATNSNTRAVLRGMISVNIAGGTVTVGSPTSRVDFRANYDVVLSGSLLLSPGVVLGNQGSGYSPVRVTGQVGAVGGVGATAISMGAGEFVLDDGGSVSVLEVTGGTVNVGNSPTPFTESASVGVLKLAGGTVTGPGILHITEALDWTMGSFTGTGCTALDNAGTANFITTYWNDPVAPLIDREFVVPEGATLKIRRHASTANYNSILFGPTARLRIEGTLEFPAGDFNKSVILDRGPWGTQASGGTLEVFGGTVNAFGAMSVTSNIKLDARNAKMGTDAGASIVFAGAQENVISGITQLDAGVTFASTLSNTFTGRISSFDGAGAVAFKVNASPDTITHTIGAAGLVVDSMLFERSIVAGGNLWVTGTLDWRNGTFQNTGRIVLPAGATAEIGTVANGTPRLNAELVVAPGATANLWRSLWCAPLGKLRLEGQLNVSRPPSYTGSACMYNTLNNAGQQESGGQMIVAGGTVFVQGGPTTAAAANLEVLINTSVQDGILRNGPNAKTYIGKGNADTNSCSVAGLSQLDGSVIILTSGEKTLSGRITSSAGAGNLALLIGRAGFTIGAQGLEVDSMLMSSTPTSPDYPDITGGDLTVTGNLDWTDGAIRTSSGGRLLLPSGAQAILRCGYVLSINESRGNIIGRNMVVSPGATATFQLEASMRSGPSAAFYLGYGAELRVEGSLLFTSLSTAGRSFMISPGSAYNNSTGGSMKLYGAQVEVQTAGAKPVIYVPVEVRNSVIKTVPTSWFGLYGSGHVFSGVNQLDEGLKLTHPYTTVTLSGTITSADGPSAVALLADQAGTFTIGSAGLVIDALTFDAGVIDGSGDIWVTRQLVAGITYDGMNLKGAGKLYLVSGATGSAKGLGRTLINEAGSTLSLGSVYTSSPFNLVNKGTLVVDQIQVQGPIGSAAMTGSSIVNEGTIQVRGTTDTGFQLPLFNAPSGQLTLASGATAKLQLFKGWLNQNTAYPLTTGTVAPGYVVSGTNPSTFQTAVTSVAAPAPVPAGFTTSVFTPTAPALVNPVSRVLAVPVMAKAAFVPDSHSSLFSPSILTISTAADSEAWTGGTFRLDSGSGTININTLLAALASGTPLTISSKGSIVFDTNLSYLGSVAGSLQLAVDTAAGNRQGFIQLPASLASAAAPLTLGFNSPVAVKSTGSTITTSGGAISFASPLGGGSSLALSAGAGAVSFASAATVGGFTSYAAATSGSITGLTAAAANTTFSGTQNLSGALSVTGGLTLSGGLTAAGAVSVSGQLAATGSASIGTVNGAISLNTVTGPGSLALSSGTAAINVAGDISSLGALSLQTAGATGTVTLSGTFDVGALNVLGGGQAVLLGGAQGLSSATSATFAAGVPVTLGDQSGDRFSFVGALASPGATGVTGIVNAGSAQLGGLTLAGSVNTSGNLSTGTLTLAGDAALGTSTGLLSTGAIAGATHALTLSSATGNVTVSGGLSQVGALTLQAVGSTGVATVSGVVDLGSLTVAGGTASLLGGNNGTSAIAGGVTVANNGVLSLGDQTGDTFGIVGAIAGGELRLAGGATASAASASLGDLRLGGILQLGGILNASAVTLTGDSLLQASGNITLASVTGAGHDLTVSAASANLVVSGGVSGVDVLTLLPLNSVSVTGSLAAQTAILGDSISVGSAVFGSTQLSGDLSGTGGNISLGAVTLGADSSVLTAGGDLSLGSVTGNGYRLILDGAAGDVTLAGGISGLAMLQLQSPTSTGDVTIAGAVNLTDLLMQGSGSLAFLGGNAGVTTLSGNISLAQTGGLRFGDQAGDQFSLNPGDLIYAGALTLGGALSLPAGQMQVGSLSLAADASIVASGQVNLGSVAVVANGHDLTVTAGGLLASAGVTGAGDLTLSGALGQSLSGSYLAGGTIQLGAADTVFSGDVVLRAAEADFTGRLLAAASPNAGSLAFEPAPATADMAIGGTASTAAFDLTAAEMALIGNGFTSLRFGSSAGSGVLTVAARLAFTAPVSFVSPSGSLVLSSSLTTAGQALSIDAALRISGTASIDTTSGGAYSGGRLSVGSIQGAVAGPSHLTLDTGSASLTLGAVGNLTPLDSLTLASDGLTTVGQDIAVRDLLRFEGPVAFGASAVRLTANTIEAGAAASFVGASTELTLASASGLPVLVGASTDSGAGAFDVTSGLLAKLADLGSVKILGGSAAITVAQPVTVGVPLVLATTGLTDISAAVGLTGDGALTVTGDLRLSGSVTGTGAGAIRVLGDLDVVANASLVTAGVIQVGSAGTSVSGAGVLTLGGTDVDFLGSTGALTLGGLIVNAGDLTLGSSSADIVRLGAGGLVVKSGSTDLRLGQLYSAGDVTVGRLVVPGAVTINLAGSDLRSTAVDIAPPGRLTIRTSNGDAALGSLSASAGGGSLLVDAGQGSVSLASASMSGPAIATVDITAGGGTLGPLRVAGDIDVTSTASSGAGPVIAGLGSVGGDIRLSGSKLSLSGTVATPGLVTVSADMAVSGTAGVLRAADVILTGAITPATASSVLTVAPYVPSSAITLGGAGRGGFHLSTSDLASIGPGFASVIFGGPGQSGNIDVLTTLAPQATLSLQTTGMTNLPYAVVTSGGAGFGVTGASVVSADITTAGGAIALLGPTRVLTGVTFDTTAGGTASAGGDITLGALTLVTTSPTANTFTIKAGANGDLVSGDILLQNSTATDVQLKILSGRDVTVGELPDALGIDSQATGVANGLPATGADPQLASAARVLRIPTRLIEGVVTSYNGVRSAINDQVSMGTQESTRLSRSAVSVVTVAPAASAPAAIPAPTARIPVLQGVVAWVGEGARTEQGGGGTGSLKLVDNLSVSVQGGTGVINYEGVSISIGEGTVVRKSSAP